ncbi:MAG: orotate phosphoribosyltransferase [Bacteroidales bacterium]
MIYNKDIARTTAEFLLQIKAVKLNAGNPFTWASGLKSPIYCDNRKILSFPKIRTFVRQEFVGMINDLFGPVDLIAGVATGAIAHGVLVAQELGYPFVYVRPQEKKHGLENRIEGHLEAGQSVVVVEDLVSTGKSSLQAVQALRDAGCEVKGMVAIFSYDLAVADKAFKESNCLLYTLSDYNELLQQAIENNYIHEDDLSTLIEWRKSPSEWSAKNGGKA